MAAILKIE